MRNRVVKIAIAGGLALGAGLLTASVLQSGVAFAQENPDSSSGEENDRTRYGHGALLEEVLADLVASGTIDQPQADAIVAAVQEAAEARRTERRELRQLIAGFLEDDVISGDELEQLPDDHPFNDPDGRFSDALEDGEITREEIGEAFPHSRRDWFKRGLRFGALLDDGGIDQAEYDGLEEDHPLKQIDVSSYLDDGVISIAELREIRKSQSMSGDGA